MTRESFSRKSISKGKSVMHRDNIYLDIEGYNEFIQCQLYDDETHCTLSSFSCNFRTQFHKLNRKPISKYTIFFPYFEILNDSGDENTQEKRKKIQSFQGSYEKG